MSKNLLPCPFCGGAARWCADEPDNKHTCHHIVCPKCQFNWDVNGKGANECAEIDDLMDYAAAVWNRRATAPAAPLADPDGGIGDLIYALDMWKAAGLGPESVAARDRLNAVIVRMAAPAAPAKPVAYRYKDSRGHWRYVGTPFTPGWEPPPDLLREPLYSHDAQSRAQAAAPVAEPAAWLDPATRDVITAERKADWLTHFGSGGISKAKTYTVPLGLISSTQADTHA